MLSCGILGHACIDAIISSNHRISQGQNMETHVITLSHKCRDNVCPPLSSPRIDFNIELFGATFQNRRFCSH